MMLICSTVKPSLKPVKPTVKEPAKPKPKQTGERHFMYLKCLFCLR